MSRILKTAALTFLVFCVPLVAASMAQAETGYFHWRPGQENPARAIFTGESLGAQLFTYIPPGEGSSLPVECAGATLAGTETGEEHMGELGLSYTTQNLTVHPTYFGTGGLGSSCKIQGVSSVLPVKTTGCHYRLAGSTGASGHAALGIECGTGAIETTFTSGTTCVIKIPTQTSTAAGVRYVNNKPAEENRWDVKATLTAEGLAYTSNSASACTLIGIAKEGTVKIAGEFTVRGYEDLKETETGVYEEGSQIGIWQGPAA
ncbi:MAG TPA: hypothetical protein VF731_01840 [Solirubrobacterales bacterium]